MSGQLDSPAAFTPGKEPRYPLNRKLGGSQSPSWRFREQKSLLLLLGCGTRTFKPMA